MSEIRYVPDAAKDCKCCLYWEGRKKGCKLGQKNCPYTPEDFFEVKKKRKKS